MNMKSIYALVWRSLNASRSRTILSLLAVALGVASTFAVSIVGQSIRRGLLKTDELQTVMGGLIRMFDPILSFIGVVIMLAAGFLIYNAFAMSVTHRRQQIGALRTVGMGRGQVWRLLIAEALVIGLAGTALGALGGPLLGNFMVAGMRAVIGSLIPLEEAPPLASDVVLALSMGTGLTLLAMLFPARHAMQIAPLAALQMHEAADMEKRPSRRAWIGAFLITLLFGYLLIDPPGAWVVAPMDLVLPILFLTLWLLALGLTLPALVGIVGQRGRGLLVRRFPGTGRLIADNLQRGRSRVTLTVFTLALAILVLTGLTGFMDFFFLALFHPTFEGLSERQVFYAGRIDPASGWTTILAQGLDSLMMSEEEVAGIQEVVSGRAAVAPMYFVISPELSFLGDSYFSVATDPDSVYRLGSVLFTFAEGDWETALPLMRAGCAVFIMPVVAARNAVRVGDSFTVTHRNGSTECAVAGIGMSAAGISTISSPNAAAFTNSGPLLAFVMPAPGVDPDQLQAELRASVPGLLTNSFTLYLEVFDQVMPMLTMTLNGMLLLALLAAAMGVINTMMMSVIERRRELGLLRAVGATRRQVRAVILGEAALMGLVGGLVGLVAGLGFTVILVVTYGGNSWGISFPLWPTALASARPVLLVGLVGLIAAPLVSAAAAWLPARRLLKDNPIEALALQ